MLSIIIDKRAITYIGDTRDGRDPAEPLQGITLHFNSLTDAPVLRSVQAWRGYLSRKPLRLLLGSSSAMGKNRLMDDLVRKSYVYRVMTSH
jgi:hypothetical protein